MFPLLPPTFRVAPAVSLYLSSVSSESVGGHSLLAKPWTLLVGFFFFFSLSYIVRSCHFNYTSVPQTEEVYSTISAGGGSAAPSCSSQLPSPHTPRAPKSREQPLPSRDAEAFLIQAVPRRLFADTSEAFWRNFDEPVFQAPKRPEELLRCSDKPFSPLFFV